jgi:hypothetical protein
MSTSADHFFKGTFRMLRRMCEEVTFRTPSIMEFSKALPLGLVLA